MFVIENVLGAGGTIGSMRAMDADFEPIGVVVEQPILIAARRDFPAKDINEFIAYVKVNADKLNMAHTGVGSNSFAYALVLNAALGVKPTFRDCDSGQSALASRLSVNTACQSVRNAPQGALPLACVIRLV